MKGFIIIRNGVVKKPINVYNYDDVNAEVDFMLIVF